MKSLSKFAVKYNQNRWPYQVIIESFTMLEVVALYMRIFQLSNWLCSEFNRQ